MFTLTTGIFLSVSMGTYVCVTLLAVIMTLAEAEMHRPSRPRCPACVCRLRAKPEDAKHNDAFARWFNAVFDKRILTCPFPTILKYYYGYRGSICECAEEYVPVKVCQSEIWKLAAASPPDKV